MFQKIFFNWDIGLFPYYTNAPTYFCVFTLFLHHICMQKSAQTVHKPSQTINPYFSQKHFLTPKLTKTTNEVQWWFIFKLAKAGNGHKYHINTHNT